MKDCYKTKTPPINIGGVLFTGEICKAASRAFLRTERRKRTPCIATRREERELPPLFDAAECVRCFAEFSRESLSYQIFFVCQADGETVFSTQEILVRKKQGELAATHEMRQRFDSFHAALPGA
jgi:hypothetical protein